MVKESGVERMVGVGEGDKPDPTHVGAPF